MKTKNYNELFEKRRIAIALLASPLRIEDMARICGLVDELSLSHTLACLRYESLLEDQGELWELTELGRAYAEWCERYPQRYRGWTKLPRKPTRQDERATA